MTSQLKKDRLNPHSDELAVTRSERDQLRARVALLESNYADLRQAARVEIELKEQEIEKLTGSATNQPAGGSSFRAYRGLRRLIGRFISLLRRAVTKSPYFAHFARQSVQLFGRLASFERPRTLLGIPTKWRAKRAEPLAPSKRLTFDDRTCLEGYQDTDLEPKEWPKNRPLVTVVVTSFNGGRLVAAAVDSVLAQTFDDIEVIVVEGRLTDAASREEPLALRRAKTRIIAQTEPHPVGANRNLGIREARGKYVCCLDADDLIRPTYIEKALFLLETSGYDVVACVSQQFGEKIHTLATPLLANMLEANHVLPCAVFRKSLWRKAGGYRDADRAITGHIDQDWLFWARLAAIGARIHNMPEDLFSSRRYGSDAANPFDSHAMAVHRNMIGRAVRELVTRPSAKNLDPTETSDASFADPLINLRGRSSKNKQSPALLLVLPATVIGGAERLLSAVVAYFAREGWRATILTTNDPGENGDSTSWFEKATTEIFHLPRFLPTERWREFTAYLIASRDIEVIWIVGSAFLYNLLPLIRTSFPNIKVVDILFNTVGHTQNNRKFAKFIDLNFVENKETLQFLVNAGESQDRILQVLSAVDLQEYEPGPREDSIVNLLNVAQDELIVGFSGRWASEKDPLMFVEIARRLLHLPIHFVMTGIGPLRSSIEAAIAAGKLGHRFHLVGEVSDVRPWIRSYDTLVLPSRLDGRPVVVLEALASGVPVIASAVGGLPELIDDGVNGFLCIPGIAAHFAGKIARLARDPELLIRMKKAARLSAEQNFDSRHMFSRYERALRDLARPEKEPVPSS